MATKIIKELISNAEDLHYPFLILDDGSKVKVATYYLNAKYPRKSNGIDLDLKKFEKEHRRRKIICDRCEKTFIGYSKWTTICPKCKAKSKIIGDQKRRDSRANTRTGLLMISKDRICLVKKGDNNEDT